MILKFSNVRPAGSITWPNIGEMAYFVLVDDSIEFEASLLSSKTNIQ